MRFLARALSLSLPSSLSLSLSALQVGARLFSLLIFFSRPCLLLRGLKSPKALRTQKARPGCGETEQLKAHLSLSLSLLHAWAPPPPPKRRAGPRGARVRRSLERGACYGVHSPLSGLQNARRQMAKMKWSQGKNMHPEDSIGVPSRLPVKVVE